MDMNVEQGSLLLIPDHPLQVLPALAAEIGLNEAIAVQQLHYWTKRSESKEGWVYNTMAEWREQFPFWSKRTIERIWTSLAKKKLVEVAQRGGTDRTNHYRLIYEQLPRYKFPSRQSGGIKPTDRRSEPANMAACLTTSRDYAESKQPPTPSGQVGEVFDFWVQERGKPNHKLTARRRKKIEGRLKEKPEPFTVAELKEAIAGIKFSRRHMGDNETREIYDDLELICRSGENVEKFRDLFREKGNGSSPSLDLTAIRDGLPELQPAWQAAVVGIQQAVGNGTFGAWIEPLRPVGLLAGVAYFTGPENVRPWAERRYSSLLAEALEDAGLADVRICFINTPSTETEDAA
jgi:hypothetical protein